MIVLCLVSSCSQSLSSIFLALAWRGSCLGHQPAGRSVAFRPPHGALLSVGQLAMGRRVASWPVWHAMALVGKDVAGQGPKLPEAGRGSVRILPLLPLGHGDLYQHQVGRKAVSPSHRTGQRGFLCRLFLSPH